MITLLLLKLFLLTNTIVIEKPPIFIEAEVSFYSELDSCHFPGCPTATGIKPTELTIACPRKYPLYSLFEIDGKVYVCHDRTAKEYDGRFDVWVGWGEEAHERAKNYGVKLQKIKIIN